MSAGEVLVCEDCGKTSREDDTIKLTRCPYAYDLHGETIDAMLCDKCEELRSDEI